MKTFDNKILIYLPFEELKVILALLKPFRRSEFLSITVWTAPITMATSTCGLIPATAF